MPKKTVVLSYAFSRFCFDVTDFVTSALDSVLAGVLFVGDRDDSTGVDGLAITAMGAFTYTRCHWLIAIRLDDDLYVNATFAAPCQCDP
jgi:hypothetical protein